MKKSLNQSVYLAAQERISKVFDAFPKIYVSFSGGKDSTVLLHMIMTEAIRRDRKVGVLFIDWEAQFKGTIDHIRNCFIQYSNHIVPYWISLPLLTVNACSMFEPEWICWNVDKRHCWVREPEKDSIQDVSFFPFYYSKMTFEEFILEFGSWFGGDQLTAGFIGIRTQESIHRYCTIISKNKGRYLNWGWTTEVSKTTYNVYPLYDWQTADIWTYHGRNPDKEHNPIYDLMYKAGLTINQMRICEPFGDESRKGLWLYHLLEPETWTKLLQRVEGVNSAALYAKDRGNILGNGAITKPEHFTWEQFAKFLLHSMPKPTAEHYTNKILIYVKWCQDHQEPLPDFQDKDLGSKDIPSWRRICKMLLKGDYWASTLSFSPNKTKGVEKYKQLMAKRKQMWQIEI